MGQQDSNDFRLIGANRRDEEGLSVSGFPLIQVHMLAFAKNFQYCFLVARGDGIEQRRAR